MTVVDLKPGDAVFVDANVFVYAFGPDPVFGPPSREFLKRIEDGDLLGFISAHVFNDVAYRLLTLEACQTFGWPFAGIGQRLRRHPDAIQKLGRFRQALDAIKLIGIHILPVDADHVTTAADLSRAHGVLSGDALIASVMRARGLDKLASNDADFERLPGITRYSLT